MECFVFGPDGMTQLFDMVEINRFKSRHPEAIHLYDGPPSIHPVRSKMVAFTSPNFSWLDAMRKNVKNHCTLYMPVWELGELSEAVNVLKLKISLEDLITRYQQFGGIPRYCLLTDSDAYRQGLIEQKEAIEKIKTFEDVQACFKTSIPKDLVVHQLLHYYPEENPRFPRIRFGTDQIGKQIYERLFNKKLDQERAKS